MINPKPPMSHKALDSRHSIDSCTIQLHTWRPFQLQPQTLDCSDSHTTTTTANASCSKPYHYRSANGVHTKRPCLSDRATSFSVVDATAIDMSKLTLIDDDRIMAAAGHYNRGSFRLIARKRRRRGSRSLSGRSSDRSGTRHCCSVGASAAYGTCSDIPVTDSSGELFGNGDANWASDVSEARKERKEREGGGSGEKESVGFGPIGGFEAQGNESGYGSEPGYRGDAEFGYGDEHDEEEEEEDARLLFWGEQVGETDSNVEGGGENTFSDQKTHYRCRRKKHDCRMVDSLR